MVVVALLSTVITIWALIFIVISEPSAGLIGGMALAITMIVFVFYIVDRILIKKFSYKKIFIGEILFGIIVILYFKYNTSTIDINISTDKDYILVLFDSKENKFSEFERIGFFGKELNVNENIVHVDSSLYNNKDLRINEPGKWGGFSQKQGAIKLKGYLINYTLRANDNQKLTIDSLLSEIEKE